MADLPAAVADTHALLFHAAASKALGRRAAAHFEACERQQALVYVPMAVIWEVSLLARASRINLRRSIRAFFDDLFSNPAYHPFDLTSEQIYLADELRFTRDPFDALHRRGGTDACGAARDARRSHSHLGRRSRHLVDPDPYPSTNCLGRSASTGYRRLS